jgi:murein DD-endopeptidase MepM/ murein hydrolase activator NlpD
MDWEVPRVGVLPLLLVAAAVAAAPASANEQGGAPAPTAGGGTQYGQTPRGRRGTPPRHPRAHRKRSARRAGRGPLLTKFALARPTLFLFGHPARVSFRIRSGTRPVRVRLYVLRQGRRKPLETVFLGERPTGISQSIFLTGRESGLLPQGPYRLRIAAKDARGRRLRRAASASGVSDLAFFHHCFPIAGRFSYGGPDARFGAKRPGHVHQGQDLAAAEGTPVVAPRGGVVKAVRYQAGGAGHYVVLDGAEEDRDYVFMHLRAGSVRVREGEQLRTGQRIGDVGDTGHSSGPHLHFEIWLGGAWAAGGHPVDPLPYLETWDRWS